MSGTARRGGIAAPQALHGAKGAILFHKREWPPFDPPRERFCHCKRAARRAAMLADCTAHSAALPRLVLLYDLACSYHPLLRSRWRLCCLTDAVHPLRVPLCPSCRSADYFPSTGALHNAASAAMPHPARSLPPSKRHSRLTIVRRGCDLSRIAEIHGEAMYTALTLRSACSHSR